MPVPVQGLGCMKMGLVHAPGGADSPSTVIRRAIDLGACLLDTADMYGGGHNERIVGRAIRGRRDEVVLCTKFGVVPGDDAYGYALRGDAPYVRAACEASLRRLDADVIDLYYLHRRDPAVPIEETVGAMAELVAEGKVRHLGLSEVTPQEMRAAALVHPIAALQSEWSLTHRAVEAVVPTCAELGVGVLPYSPQAHGALAAVGGAGRGGAGRGGVPEAVRAALVDVAARHGTKPGQIALAWVQSRAEHWGVTVTALPGTTRVTHLEENVAATRIVLSADDLSRLDQPSRQAAGR